MERLIQYLGNHPWLSTAAAVMVAVVVAYEIRMRSGNQLSVSPQDAVRIMNQGALVLDLRPQDLYSAGHVNGARQMPSDQILLASESLKKYKEKPVLVYCGDGALGAAAARQLAAQGFTKAVHLRGGLTAWRAENLPLVRG
jgi:rhodanese-related sulfurtransferase